MTDIVHVIVAPTQEVAEGYALEQGWRPREWERIATARSAVGRIFPAERWDIVFLDTVGLMPERYSQLATRRWWEVCETVTECVRRTGVGAATIREVRW